MAIRLIDRYPGRATAESSDYPDGAVRNKTDPTADDGTPLEQDWANDYEAFFQGILQAAGITPNGSVDTVPNSQLIDALVKVANGVTEVDVAGSSNVAISTDDSRIANIHLTGELTGDIEVQVPDAARVYGIINDSTGSFDITFRTTGGSGVVVPRGLSTVRSDGNDIVWVSGSTENAASIAKRNAIRRQVTSYNYTKHKAFGVVDRLPSGRWLMLFREGTEHLTSEAIIRQIYTDDGGITWSAPETVYSDSPDDCRNLGGGTLPNGDFVALFEVWPDGSGNDCQTIAKRTTDEGQTWEAAVTLRQDANIRVVPYGKFVNAASESFLFAYEWDTSIPGLTQRIHKLSTSDNGATWSTSVVYDSADWPSSSTEPTEPSLVHVGSGRIIGVVRDESSDTSWPKTFYSTDDGATWSTPAAISWVSGGSDTTPAMGKNSPILWHDTQTNYVHLIWPSRGSGRNPSGGSGMLWPWYISSVAVDSYFNDETLWRIPTALPIHSPSHGPGDSGYQHLVQDNAGSVFMLYYSGNIDNGAGTDFYISNMTTVDGIEA